MTVTNLMYAPKWGAGHFGVCLGFFTPLGILNVSLKPCFSFALITASFITFFFAMLITPLN